MGGKLNQNLKVSLNVIKYFPLMIFTFCGYRIVRTAFVAPLFFHILGPLNFDT